MLKKLIIQFCFIVSTLSIYMPLANAQSQKGEDSAVIIMYHRFGEGDFPTTNVTIEQFEHHIEELDKDIYNIVATDAVRIINIMSKMGKLLRIVTPPV